MLYITPIFINLTILLQGYAMQVIVLMINCSHDF